ncbi:hypothetical protein ACRPFF_11145, partial [Neisseria sp. SLRRB23]|uniref:hypothetical protein n=1 Tax=Neisseria sp. SLRRB23 TaxID=3435199 RepID=UPI003D7F468F
DRLGERVLLKVAAAIEKIAGSKDGGTVAEKLSKAADEGAAGGKDASSPFWVWTNCLTKTNWL